MIIKRQPPDDFEITRIYIWPNGQRENTPWCHTVQCGACDYDFEAGKRLPPTAKISLLGTPHNAAWEDVRRLADDYAVIADIAMKLEAEMRAAYDVDRKTHSFHLWPTGGPAEG